MKRPEYRKYSPPGRIILKNTNRRDAQRIRPGRDAQRIRPAGGMPNESALRAGCPTNPPCGEGGRLNRSAQSHQLKARGEQGTKDQRERERDLWL